MATPENAALPPELRPDDPLIALAAAEEAERTGAAQEATPPEPEAKPESERLYAGKYKTVEEFERGFQEGERFRGQQANEIGQLRQRLEQLESMQQAEPTGPALPQGREFLPDGTPILSMQELQELRDEDPYTAARLEGKYELFQARYEMEQQQAERNAPIVQMTNDLVARTALETLRDRVGDDLLTAHKDALAEAMTNDPTYFEDVKTRVTRMEWVVRAAAQQAGTGTGGQVRDAQGRFAGPDVHTEGGSGAAPAGRGAQDMTPEERELQELLDYAPQKDTFGEKPYLGPKPR